MPVETQVVRDDHEATVYLANLDPAGFTAMEQMRLASRFFTRVAGSTQASPSAWPNPHVFVGFAHESASVFGIMVALARVENAAEAWKQVHAHCHAGGGDGIVGLVGDTLSWYTSSGEPVASDPLAAAVLEELYVRRPRPDVWLAPTLFQQLKPVLATPPQSAKAPCDSALLGPVFVRSDRSSFPLVARHHRDEITMTRPQGAREVVRYWHNTLSGLDLATYQRLRADGYSPDDAERAVHLLAAV